jgi:ABC-type sugar transport system ATPase subunit
MTEERARAVSFLTGRGISKSFGNVRALQNVDIEVREAEILAIVGDNGAGKSTLTKILTGIYQPDQGDLSVAGERTRIGSPLKAREVGIAAVLQDLALVDCRDVASNLFLGCEPTRWGIFVDRQKMLREAERVLEQLEVHLPSVDTEVRWLSGGQRQGVAIGRVMLRRYRVVFMDEPTAALGVKESRRVLDLILRLKSSGAGIVIISHDMQHVFSVADRILVLRQGKVVGERDRTATTPQEVVEMIVGAHVL